MRIVLILLLVLYAVKAHSAEEYVLFIDTNNSPLEIKAAREAAEKSGRRLLVMPDISEKDRKAYLQMGAKLDAARAIYEKACDGKNETACRESEKKFNEAEKSKSDLLETFQLTEEKVSGFLAAHQNKTVSSVVISGHDGTGSFSGEFGGVSDIYLATELEKYPNMKNAIRTLHLWGCYTTSPGSLLLNWKKHFPNISLLTGYEGRAPLADKPAGWHYLKGVLAKEPELLRAGDSAKLQRLLKKLPGANQVTAAIYSCGDYATNKEHYSLTELDQRCNALRPQLEDKGPEFECYLKGSEEKCANPPEDIARGSVRQFYELLHKSAACTQISKDQVFRTYSRDSAIRLVFGREVQKNFENIYAKKLSEIDETLEKLGAPERIRFKKVGSLSRREVLQRIDDLLDFLRKQKHDPMQDPEKFEITERDAQIASLRQFQERISNTLAQLPDFCVPFNWTEPNQKQKSDCMTESLIGNEGTKLFLDPQSRLKNSLLSGMSGEAANQEEQLKSLMEKTPDPLSYAKIEALGAQSEKLRAYAQSADGNISPELRKRIALREDYAKLTQELAKKGVRHFTSDPQAMKLLLAINKDIVESTIKHYENSIENLENDIKKASETNSAAYTDLKESAQKERAQLEVEKSILEVEKLFQSEDWSDWKAEQLSQLEFAIGSSLRSTKTAALKSTINYYQIALRNSNNNNTLPADLEYAKKAVKEAEEHLLKENSASTAKIREKGHRYIFQIRH